MSSSLRPAAVAIAAVLFTGCGGGGGGSSTPAAPVQTTPPSQQIVVPQGGQVNPDTTYTVYYANGSPAQIAIAPINGGPPDAVNSWTVATGGALVFYPDGSTQVSDVLGNFDASQSSWATANATALAANPQMQPDVQIAAIGIGAQTPLDTTVSAFAPGIPLVPGSTARAALGSRDVRGSTTAAGAELASVTVLPRGVAMFDNEARTFTVVGTDTDGNYVSLRNAVITWSVKNCSGTGAGSITQGVTGNAASAKYTPPKSGTFTCPDQVVATVTAASGGATSTVAGTANAFYYDASSGATVSGTLVDSGAKPVGGGLVVFYGGGREFYHGNLVAYTNSAGQFTRTVPPNRTLAPVGGNITTAGAKPTASFFTLTPATITVGGSGSSVAPATYTEGGPFVNAFKPLPAYDRILRDAYGLSDVAVDPFPFGRPLANGNFPTCSIDAIISNQSDSTGCTKIGDNGYYNNWTIAKSGGTYIFQQPATQEGGRHLLQIAAATNVAAPNGISDAVTKAASCSSAACFSFAAFYNPAGFTSAVTAPVTSAGGTLSGAPNGTILALDGGFAETNGNGGAFTVQYLRNVYTVGHQVQGNPLYTHTQSYAYASGSATTAQLSDNWYNASGLPTGTLAVTITPAPSSGVLASYTGTGTRTYYSKGVAVTPSVAYTISGRLNADHTATSTLTINTSPDKTAAGSTVTLNYVDPGTATCPSGYPAPLSGNVRICASLTNPNVTNLAGQFVALYTVDTNYYTTVTLDPNLASGTAATFRL